MALYNPLLGNIPRPDKESDEVSVAFLPKSNYSAQRVTPIINTLFIQTLETTNTATDSYDTTAQIVLTQLIFQGKHTRSAGGSTLDIDLFINGVKIISLNYAIQDSGQNNFNFNIPFENVLIEANSRFYLTATIGGGGGGSQVNASFIGYYPTKQ